MIIGTFPTHQNNYKSTFEFYYAGEKNRFWDVISDVFKPQFKYFNGKDAIKEREEFFSQNKIGITDMLVKCWRRNNSSQDFNLYPIILNDIFKILREYKMINTLILTSRTEGVGALGLLISYFLQQGRELGRVIFGKDRIGKASFEFEHRVIKVLIPHSTSSSNEHVTFTDLVAMYKVCLKE